MKLKPHQKEIVKEIINGRVYDIPTYIRMFNKGKQLLFITLASNGDFLT